MGFDGTYIYAGIDMTPAKIYKLNPATMATVGSPWVGDAGENSARAPVIPYSGGYLYAGLNTSPGQVIKVRVSDMQKVAKWTGGTGDNSVMGMAFLSPFVYAGLYIATEEVIKIDPVGDDAKAVDYNYMLESM
jgi:hypothetical protein